MRTLFVFLAAWILLLDLTLQATAASAWVELPPARIKAIAAMLSPQPAGFGRPCSDRAFWQSPATLDRCGTALTAANKLLGETFPPWSDDLYLDFSRTGQRPPGEKMLAARKAWLQPLVVAECLENRGRFLPLLNQVLHAFASEPTWTLPAHDGGLGSFHRENYFVDLGAAAFGADLAEALYLLDDRLDPVVQQEVRAALETRIFAPIRHSLATGKGTYWLGSRTAPVQNNWNAVCLAGVVSAACAVLPDRADRALFIAAGEHYSRYFINSFDPDGYCLEGPGYWAFGFGHYAILRTAMLVATDGRLELFAHPKIKLIAAYGFRIQLANRLVPPFEDCRYGLPADPYVTAYCNQVFQFGIPGCATNSGVEHDRLDSLLMPVLPIAPLRSPSAAAGDFPGDHSYFKHPGVLVCRPSPGTNQRFSAAIKAGGNGSHSHNDIGSFVISVADQILAGDPGGPFAYNNKVFGPGRFTYKILNSFGHPVPVVAGQLQSDATRLHPRVTSTHFGAGGEDISIDLQSAYPVPELRSLVRTMHYSRTGPGAVVIEDQVAFSRPMTFAEGLPTLGSVKRLDASTLELSLGGQAMDVTVETPDGFELTSERVEELGAPAFTRLGFQLLKPVRQATIKITFHPPVK